MVEIPTICRYCGGAVHLVPAAKVYGPAAAKRLGLEREKFYQCQNCNARVGCHKGSARPLGNLANEALRMKRMETHQVFDSFWKERGMSRTQGYKWMAKKLRLSEELAHIGGFEMDRCQKLIRLCEKERNKEKKKEAAYGRMQCAVSAGSAQPIGYLRPARTVHNNFQFNETKQQCRYISI